MIMRRLAPLALLFVALPLSAAALFAADDDGWESLFDGKTMDAWKVPDSGIWEVKDGVIHGDVRKAGMGEQSLWSKKSYKDFVLKLEWKIWETPFKSRVPVILPDGTQKKDE